MTTIVKKLKALFDFLRSPSEMFVSRLIQIHDKMLGNAAIPNRPLDLTAFLAAITTFRASVIASLDGGKLVKMPEQLGHYVEAASNNDPVMFTSSGSEIRSTTRVPAGPLVQTVIESLDQGQSSEILVSFSSVANARIYEVESAPVTAGRTPPVWTRTVAKTARRPVMVCRVLPTGARRSSVWSSSLTKRDAPRNSLSGIPGCVP